jgi:hypothetical protein
VQLSAVYNLQAVELAHQAVIVVISTARVAILSLLNGSGSSQGGQEKNGQRLRKHRNSRKAEMNIKKEGIIEGESRR